jgi:hypothetical protein
MASFDVHEINLQALNRELSDELKNLRQNQLLNEKELIQFCKDRDIPIFGVVSGDPSKLQARGWLTTDGIDADGSCMYHPFRFFVIHIILDSLSLPLTRSAYLEREAVLPLLEHDICDWLPSDEKLGELSAISNRIVELAVLLEPLYWPKIAGYQLRTTLIPEEKLDITTYHNKVKSIIAALLPEEWEVIHEQLRFRAANIDTNDSLYLLLRVASWNQRKNLKGKISLALWIRHIAELIRLAFEEHHNVSWPEEDRAFEVWSENGRWLMYGSDRPLDDPTEAQLRLAFLFRLATGSSVRWYVEGDTEYHAILEVIPNPSKVGIELLNLKGNIAGEKDNIAMKLSDSLMQDLAHRRLSIISFDKDVTSNVKHIQKQINEDRIVGYIAAHEPDFEFANFTLKELIEIASEIDEEYGVSGQCLLDGDWHDVSNARQFEKRYCELSARKPRSLKGSEWGKHLARYAQKHSRRSDNQEERSFCVEVRAGLLGKTVHYDYQKEKYCFDKMTFKLKKREISAIESEQ